MTDKNTAHELNSILCVWRRVLGVAAGGLTIFLTCRLFFLINHYSVNTLFWDNWNYYFVFSGPFSVWQLFQTRLGPHRLGVGLVVSWLVSSLSGWNMRTEAFLIGFWIVGATLAALALKLRLFGTLAWHDVIIPLLLLTPMQWEIWTNTVNSSHGAIPLFLVIFYCLAWTLRIPAWRYGALLTVNFLAIFTGFSVFLGGITIALLTAHGVFHLWRGRQAAALADAMALIVAFGSVALFLHNYKLDPALPSFKFPDPHANLYPVALALAMARACGFLGIGAGPILGGSAALLIAMTVLVWNLPAAIRIEQSGDPRGLVIVILLGFSLIFMIDMVIGRMSLGLEAVQGSRYVPLEMPGMVGLYFAALAAAKPLRNLAIGLMLLVALWGGLVIQHPDHHLMRIIADRKSIWVKTYLATLNIDLANQASGTVIHPDPVDIHLMRKLRFLRKNHLSFFRSPPTDHS